MTSKNFTLAELKELKVGRSHCVPMGTLTLGEQGKTDLHLLIHGKGEGLSGSLRHGAKLTLWKFTRSPSSWTR